MNLLTNEELAKLRVDYTLKAFDETDADKDPIQQFKEWLNEAVESNVNEPNAMTLATVKENGFPSARIVLLKSVSEHGFTFFTNYQSNKGEQLNRNPNAALVFCWLELQRQVRIEGVVSKLSPEESDEYFYSRPLGSRIGAIVSAQSKIIEGRHVLENAYKLLEQKPASEIKRPEYWGGYIVKPSLIEFWQGRSSRLHDRLVFNLNGDRWIQNRLAP